ncbi:hypothetical protein E9531_15490 [Lampropedia puyangensis]|uniref:Uncharacterized protein n=1 Tax=Lampropedia puyangensis TaxID=1330072 RepID=A0A4S8ES38_9BURK|nr:hypothetical protein [Lampropedia puyangensis]THT97699.1 hypothetical protein E9531_15490 [Lampropedia puyangensis]
MKHLHFYDLVTLWLDSSTLEQGEWVDECSQYTATKKLQTLNPKWKTKLELHQPSSECLKFLKKSLGTLINHQISKVEFALDIVPSEHEVEAAIPLASKFLKNCYLKAVQTSLTLKDETTWYSGQRDSSDKIFVIYCDRPSKPARSNGDCFHMEWRLHGEALQAVGATTLSDLIAFDHEAFWNAKICVTKSLAQTQFGQLLHRNRQSHTQVKISDPALRKLAREWRQSFTLPYGDMEQFVMHNALVKQPKLKRQLLSQQPFGEWLQELIQA